MHLCPPRPLCLLGPLLLPLLLPSPCVSSTPSSDHVCRVYAPWDLLRGRDVFKDSVELEHELDDSSLAHWAPNCATFSRAREIPIKNVANPPRPLRSTEHPAGIPAELCRLSKKSLKRLKDDTRMADMAAENCLRRHRRGQKIHLGAPREINCPLSSELEEAKRGGRCDGDLLSHLFASKGAEGKSSKSLSPTKRPLLIVSAGLVMEQSFVQGPVRDILSGDPLSTPEG